ncbi:MAG: mechanosensitive ion channel [Polyangiaceae bacterium]
MPEWANKPWIMELWKQASANLPKLGAALLILILGWLAALIVSKLIFAALRRTTIDDKIASALGMKTGSEHGARVERFVSKVFYYVGILFVAIAFFNYLGITAVTTPIVTLLNGLAGAVPSLLKALIIGFVGFIVAKGVRRLIVGGLGKLGLERRLEALGGDEASEDDKDHSPTETIGEVAYWVILVVTAIPVLEALRIGVLAEPLSKAFAAITTYLPKVGAAALLLLAGYFLSKLARRVVSSVLSRVGVDRAVVRLGFGRVTGEHSLSGILGTAVMAFILLQFAIGAVGRLEIEEISAPLKLMLDRIYVYLPKLFIGAVLLAIGVIAARVAARVAARLLAALGFNTLMAHIGIFKQTSESKSQEETSKALLNQRLEASGGEPASQRADETDELLGATGSDGARTPADIAGVFVGAVIVLLFLRQALETMALDGLAVLLDSLLAYLPSAFAAVLVVGAGLWAGGWARQRIAELTGSSKDSLVKATGPIAQVAIIAFSAMVALQQLGVGRQLIAIGFAIVLGSVCLAFALAFGLGGREVASKVLEKEYRRRQ